LTDGSGLVWWAEGRPHEGGRTQIVCRDNSGGCRDVLAEGASANTRIHEYGGGAWLVDGSVVFYVEDADQRIRRLDTDRVGAEPDVLTPEPVLPRGQRYALGGIIDGWLICVQELHDPAGGEPLNRLVAVSTEGSEPVVLFEGTDFVGTPAVDPSSALVAFVTWEHPDMPWDRTRLWAGRIDFDDGGTPRLVEVRIVAGEANESICQPRWAPDGRLWFISDRSNWWNLYAFDEAGLASGLPRAVDAGAHEVGEPAWVFGQSRYCFLGDGRVVAARRAGGRDELVVIDPSRGAAEVLEVGSTEISSLAATGTTALFVGASPLAEPAVHALLVGRRGGSSPQVLRLPRDLGFSSAYLSAGRHITFPTGPLEGEPVAEAHGIFYPPVNPDAALGVGELPPLLVMIHGGPTSSARNELRLGVQFWTSRGIAVVDVDYRGSTGYGRAFRDALRGEWGVADVEDCVAAARHLAAEGLVDAKRLLIRGGSAGGFTALAALTFTDVFAAGASYYGVADLALLATETHKFEAHYLDSLVGPYPEAAALYAARSPLSRIAELDRPVIVFQGEEDHVVPPSQALAILEALAARGVTHASMMLAGEGHGFRKAENIRATLEAELSFYLQVLGIPHPADLPTIGLR